MRNLLFSLLIFIASPALATTVTGEGNSFTTALNNAFKKAVDFEVGVIIDAERSVINNKLTRNQILTYSAGYILAYNILEHHPIGNLQYVKVDVTVDKSLLKDFVLSSYISSERFDGENISKQLESYQKQQADGDKLIDNTFKYFPSIAINIKMRSYEVITDPDRNYHLKVYYTATWNKAYLDSLKELMTLFATNAHGAVTYLDFEDTTLYFSDNIIHKKINQTFLRGSMVEMTATTLLGVPILNTCVQGISHRQRYYTGLYTNINAGIRFYINNTVDNVFKYEIDQDLAKQLQEMSQIKLSIKGSQDC